jgi:hypothetical protein
MMNIYAQPYIRFGQPAPDLMFLAAGLAGAVLYRSNQALLALAVIAVLGVPVASWLISQWRPIMNGKTLLWLAPVFLVLVALGCTHARRSALLLTALLAALQLAACRQHLAARFDEGFPEVASILRDKALPGDIIILGTMDEEILLTYYGWPRDRLGVFAASGPAWFRTFDGRPIQDANFAAARRVWILTRSAHRLHDALAQRLGGGMTRSFNRMVGHGLLRNQPIQTLELSLFSADGG